MSANIPPTLAMAALTHVPISIDETTSLTDVFLDCTTCWLSTLHAPIEPLEELLSVSALTSSLLQSLQSTIRRLELDFHPTKSFLHPLTQDIGFANNQLDRVVKNAQVSGIWESGSDGNNKGVFVNGGRASWCVVCGNEDNAKRLRSRFFVEKYRVRVLIDAVTWFGLRKMGDRSLDQEREFAEVEKRLGTVAERLLGVWRDYTPRLQALERGVGKREREMSRVQQQRILELQMGKSSAPPRYEAMASSSSSSAKSSQMVNEEKKLISRTDSCGSCCSNHVLPQEITYETYLLRQNAPTSTLKTSTRILGILFSTTNTHTPATFYIKPLPSSLSEISSYRQASLSTFTSKPFFSSSAVANEETHLLNLRKKILSLPESAQWEIQKLVESREQNTSSRNFRREYEVCGLVTRPRRKINHASLRKGWFWQSKSTSKFSSTFNANRVCKRGEKRDKRDQIEYIVVLRSKVGDFEERNGFGNGSANGRVGGREEEIRRLQQRQLSALRCQANFQAQASSQANGNVMRQTEQKKVRSKEEVVREMERMCADLFRLRGDVDEESGSEDMDVDVDVDTEEEEDDGEDEEDEEDQKVEI